MKLGLSEAAVSVGRSKSTIYRNVKSGKISAKMNEEGEYEIDPAELHRVYPSIDTVARDTPQNVPLEQSESHVASASQAHMKQMEWFQEMIKSKDEELSQVRTQLNDTRERLTEHRNASRALIDPKTFEEKQTEWKQALAERQDEIKQARADADALRQEQTDQIKLLQVEKKRNKKLESRGLIARILNRSITVEQ